MTGDFIEGSTATGILAAVHTIHGIQFFLFTGGNATITNLVGGQYRVSLFVIEAESGLPFNRTAMIPQLVSVASGKCCCWQGPLADIL